MRQGDTRGTEMDFFDYTYDGNVLDGHLSSGLGQLTDFDEGNANFRLDVQNLGRKGYEWVAWRTDVTVATAEPIEIVFEFDVVRNFSAVVVTANNFFSKEISVFSSARVYYSIGGKYFDPEFVEFAYARDSVMEYSRPVTVALPHRVGRFVKLALYFDAKWLMISEVRFIGGGFTIYISI